MAGTNVQPEGSAPQQQPYGYQPQPQYGQQYGPGPTPLNVEGLLRKLVLLIIIAIGALLMFIGKIVGLYATGNAREGALISTFGAFAIATGALVWALGSKRTTDYQNLGLLILAAILLGFYGLVFGFPFG